MVGWADRLKKCIKFLDFKNVSKFLSFDIRIKKFKMSGNRNKKNGKKNKFGNTPEVLQVKSVKLETHKANNKDGKSNAKSEDNLRKGRKFNILKSHLNYDNDPISNEGGMAEVKKTNAPEDELPLVMEYCPEFVHEKVEQPEDFAATYKYYTKNTKSIKFTNQVTVLYFNGEDILCESMEPLKKEQDQQLRNKEMRKEHLMSKGPIDNLYLF
ncbi:uncharacterized protein LOC135135648 isoform X2 [Zophobas morio]|uniref:uncharacterized protein LOC135135648 isoform X2 n=1 Tax=Zophobas morio TaxID=2755281 RepID=UPI003083A4A7